MKRLSLILICSLLLPVFAAYAIDEEAKGEIKPGPWSGDWFSRKKGFMVLGWPGHTPSPLERYDQYVQTRTGKNPGSHLWEKTVKNTHYNPNAEDWEGHCNGWSAASIMEPEPKETKKRNGIVFETADQKAILTEMHMNTYCMFYGKRYWGNHGDDKDDIYPDQFHQLLLEYIAAGKSAMICDIVPERQVWNFPLYKFETSLDAGWFDKKKMKVKTTCYFGDDGVRPDYIGTKWFAVSYTYNLHLDDDGNIVSGEWTGESKNKPPDFVWVPTADAPNPPGTVEENPSLDPKFVHEITQGPPVMENHDTPAPTPDAVIVEAGLNPRDLF